MPIWSSDAIYNAGAMSILEELMTVPSARASTASIVMVSPPEDGNKAAWQQKTGGSPFK